MIDRSSLNILKEASMLVVQEVKGGPRASVKVESARSHGEPVNILTVLPGAARLMISQDCPASDLLGLKQLLCDSLVPARMIGQQVAALDNYKLKLKALEEPVEAGSLVEAYVTMLQLYLHPAATFLKKAVHRVLVQLKLLATDSAAAQALERHACETVVAHADRVSCDDPEQPLVVRLGVLQEMAAYQPTRRLLCAKGDAKRTQRLLTVAVSGLEAGGDAGLHDEALKAVCELLHGWRAESEAHNFGKVLVAEGYISLVEHLLKAIGAVLTWSGCQPEMRAHAAQAFALTLVEAFRDDVAGEKNALYLWSCCFPSDAPVAHSDLPPPFSLVSSLVARMAEEVRLCVIRAVLVVAPMAVLSWPVNSSRELGTTIFGGPVTDCLLDGCSSSHPGVRLMSFSALDTWLSRALDWCKRSKTCTEAPIQTLQSLEPWLSEVCAALPSITNVIVWNWEHTNRKVLSVIPSVFERLVSVIEASESLPLLEAPTMTLRGLCATIAQQPDSRRSRCAGLKTLLGHMGPKALLEVCLPGTLAGLVQAVAMSNSSAAPAARLFLSIIDLTSKDEGLEVSRGLWVGPVCQGLVSADRSARTRIAEYLLPTLLSADGAVLSELAGEVRARGHRGNGGDVMSHAYDVVSWALMVVGETGRSLGLPVLPSGTYAGPEDRDADQPGATGSIMTYDEVRAAALCGDNGVCLAALRLLTASVKTTEPPNPCEQAILEEMLPHILKAPTSSNRHGMLRALRPLCARYSEAIRVGMKNTNSKRTASETSAARLSEVEAAVAGLTRPMAECIYPGVGLSRDAAALEALHLSLSHFRVSSEHTRTALATVYAPQVVFSLLMLFLASWERTRQLAFDLLTYFPAPLPGLETPEALQRAVAWATNLLSVPRRAESEAGALSVRLIFRVYILRLKWKLELAPSRSGHSTASSTGAPFTNGSSAFEAGNFLLNLVEVIRSRVSAFESGLALWDHGEVNADEQRTQQCPEVTMVHGWIEAARYVLDEAVAAGVHAESGWSFAVAALWHALEMAMAAALKVVGTRELGEEDEEATAGGEAYKVVGPVVDCRGHLVGMDGEGEDDDMEGPGGPRQRLVVGGWLMARETGTCLAAIVRALIHTEELQEGKGTEETVAAIGDTLLLALQRVKHMGALKCTAQAFGSICALLLRQSVSSALGGLPSLWLDQQMARLKGRDHHVFVLRRSAALAFGCLAVVGAEPTDRPAVLLPRLMEELLVLAQPPTAESADGVNGNVEGRWRPRVHALNILRLILTDRSANPEVTHQYLRRAMEVTLLGFCDQRWAIRNSSLMCFGAVVLACVGSAKNELGFGEQSVDRTPHDFFKRHPDFLDLVVAEFCRAAPPMPQGDEAVLRGLLSSLDATSGDTGAVTADGAPKAEGEIAPTLFPLLLLLSRLRPSGQVAEDQSGPDVALRRCLAHVVRCACMPDGLLRTTASRALGALVSLPSAAALLVALATALPKTPHAMTRLSHNALHGFLLCCNTLLRVIASGPANNDEGPALANGMTEPLALLLCSRQWIAGPQMLCPPVRQEALSVLALCRHLCSDDQKSAVAAVIDASVADLSVMLGRLTTDLLQVPGLAQLCGWVTAWVYSRGITEDTLRWISHPVPEVRREALRGLLSALGRPDRLTANTTAEDVMKVILGSMDPPALPTSLRACARSVLHGQFVSEDNPLLRRGLLSGLCALVPPTDAPPATLPDKASGVAPDADIWPLLVGLVQDASAAGRVATSEGAGAGLELLASMVSSSIQRSSGETRDTRQRIELFSSLAASAAMPHCSPTMRLASLTSIRASGLLATCLGNGPEWPRPMAIEACWALLALVQDDEETIREAARDVHHQQLLRHLLQAKAPLPCLPSATVLTLRVMSRAPDAASAAAFARGTARIIINGCEGLKEALEAHTDGQKGATSAAAREERTVIFKPEPNNVYLEPCVMAFHCTRALLDLLVDIDLPIGCQLLSVGDTEGLNSAAGVLASHLRPAVAATAWLGGVTFDPEVLPRLLCAALGALVLLVTLGVEGEATLKMLGDSMKDWHECDDPHHELAACALRVLASAFEKLTTASSSQDVRTRAKTISAIVNWDGLARRAPFVCPTP